MLLFQTRRQCFIKTLNQIWLWVYKVLKFKFDSDSQKLATLMNSSTSETSGRCNDVFRKKKKTLAKMVQTCIQHGNNLQLEGPWCMINKWAYFWNPLNFNQGVEYSLFK